MDFLASLPGEASLDDTERACEVEQNPGFQLESIQFGTLIKEGTVFLVNKAAFDLKPFGRLKDLSFIEIKATDDPKTVKTTRENAGWTFICDSQIYVSKNVTRVMVFGKK